MNCECSIVELDKLILGSKVTEDRLGKNLKDELFYGWSCDIASKQKVDKLQTYRKYIEKEYRNILMGGKPCLDCEERQLWYEKITKITTNCDTSESRPDVIVNKDRLEKWLLKNPYCVSREKWEYLAYEILCDLQIDVDLIDKNYACDITMDIVKKEIPCDIIVAVSAYHINCDLGLSVTRKSQKECKMDFEVTAKKAKNCELSFDMYKKLIDKNVGDSIIGSVLENGCCLSIEKQLEEDIVVLQTENGDYPVNTMKFNGLPDIQSLGKYEVDTSDSEYLKNPEGFIKNLNKDYSG